MDLSLPFQGYLALHSRKHLALYHAIRDAIREGRFEPGFSLPSERDLARQMQLSRGTVRVAYEMLQADDYIRSHPGARYRVSFIAGEVTTSLPPETLSRKEVPHAHLSQWANQLPPVHMHALSDTRKGFVDLGRFFRDPSLFPEREWKSAVHEALRELDYFKSPGEIQRSGWMPLREAVAAHLRSRRGLDAHRDNVVIVNGSIQAISLLGHLLIERGDRVVVENPSYAGIGNAVRAAGGRPLYAKTDDHGILPADWKSRLAFVTPTNQFPTGGALPLERRRELVLWAEKRDALIVEDDYDAEFRRQGRPLEPLRMLSRDRVIYTGSFSRSLSHHLRLGYVLLPETLIEPFLRAKSLFEPLSPAVMEQASLARFMRSGAYERHLRRMTRLYARKYGALMSLLEENLPGLFRIVPSDTGLHAFAWWTGSSESFVTFLAKCEEGGVRFLDARRYFFGEAKPCTMIGFAGLTESDMAHALRMAGRIARSAKIVPVTE